MKPIAILMFLMFLGLNCSKSVVYYEDVCEGIALNQFDSLELYLDKVIQKLDKKDGDEENFKKIQTFIEAVECVERVKIFRGLIQTQPVQKEFLIDFSTGVSKIIDVYVLEEQYAYYRMHD